ncbi:MAG: TolC family protein [Bacteroidetes bacterium]|nr:TolC family protein [Bacteroidota bacterium]
MKKPNRNNLLILLLLLCFSAGAQNRYTLHDLIDRVLQENYQVQMVKLDEQVASNNNTAGNAGMLPSVSASGSQTVSYYDTEQKLFTGDTREANNARSTFLSGQIALDWTVFDGLRMFAMKDQLGLLEQIGQVNTRYYIEQTVADVAMLYEQLIAFRQLLSNEKKALEVSAFRLKIEERKLKVGAGDALQYNQALVDFNDDSLAVLSRMRNIKSLEIQTNRIINTDPEAPVNTADSTMTAILMPVLDSLISQAEQANSKIEQSVLEEMVAETNVKVQKAAYFPTVDLMGQYNYSYSTSKIGYATYNKNYGPLLGVSVRFNLFDGNNVRRTVKNAELSRDQAGLSKKDVNAFIKSSITDQYYQWQSLQQQLKLAIENRASALKSMEIAELQFQKGLIDGYNFRLTQVSVLRAANAVIQMELAIRLLEISLNRQAGTLMEKYY